MRSRKFLLILLLFITYVPTYALSSVAPAPGPIIILKIDGFTCSMCAKSVENSLRSKKFVKSVAMDLNAQTAIVELKTYPQNYLLTLAKAVEQSGFSINSIQIRFPLETTVTDSNSIFIFENQKYQIIQDTLVNKRKEPLFLLLHTKALNSERKEKLKPWLDYINKSYLQLKDSVIYLLQE